MLTGDQLRMARAALRLTVKDTAELAGIDKGTIVRIEGGEKAYRLTLARLREVLEAKGVEFLDAQEGVGGSGVRFRWGYEVPSRTGAGSTEASGADDGGMKALDEEMATHWRRHPEEWAGLSETGRHVLSAEMFGDPYAADEAFAALTCGIM